MNASGQEGYNKYICPEEELLWCFSKDVGCRVFIIEFEYVL